MLSSFGGKLSGRFDGTRGDGEALLLSSGGGALSIRREGVGEGDGGKLISQLMIRRCRLRAGSSSESRSSIGRLGGLLGIGDNISEAPMAIQREGRKSREWDKTKTV